MMIYIILLFGVFLRVINLNRNFWFGETASLLYAQSTPSLKYLFLHYWLKLGIFDEWFIRLPNIIFALLTLVILFFLTKLLASDTYLKLNNHKLYLPLLVVFLLTINPLHIYYSQALESYSFYLLLFLVIAYLFLSWLKSNQQRTYKTLSPHHLAHALLFLTLLTSYSIFLFPTKAINEDWDNAFKYVNSQVSPEQSQVIFAYGGMFPPAAWYQPNMTYLSPLNELIQDDPSRLDLRLHTGTVGKSDIYYFRYLELLTDPNRNITTWLSNAGYTLIDTVSFPGIGSIDRYQAN